MRPKTTSLTVWGNIEVVSTESVIYNVGSPTAMNLIQSYFHKPFLWNLQKKLGTVVMHQ